MMSLIQQRKSHDDDIKRFFSAMLAVVLCCTMPYNWSVRLFLRAAVPPAAGLVYMSRLRRKRLVVIGPFASRDAITNVRHHLVTCNVPSLVYV